MNRWDKHVCFFLPRNNQFPTMNETDTNFKETGAREKQIRLAWLFTKWELEPQPHACILLFVSEGTSLQHFFKFTFNYELIMTAAWKECFIFNHILPQRPTQTLPVLLIRNIPYCILREERWCHEMGFGVGQNQFQMPAPKLF